MVNPSGSNTLLPTSWGITVGATSQLALPANPSRSGLMWINQSSSVIAICTAFVTLVAQGGTVGTLVAQAAVINGAGSITMQPGDKFIIDNMPCGCQWNAIAATAGAALTAFETY